MPKESSTCSILSAEALRYLRVLTYLASLGMQEQVELNMIHLGEASEARRFV